MSWKHDEPTPLPENDCDCSERAPKYEYWECPKCGAEWYPEENDTEVHLPDPKPDPCAFGYE